MSHSLQPARTRRDRLRRRSPRRYGVALVVLFQFTLVAALAGCATSADPRDGGFVNGIVGLGGGGYQRRIDERRDTLSAEQAAQRQLAIEQREVEAERDAVRGELQRAEQRLAAQQRRIAAERARILALEQKSAADRARLAELKRAEARAGDAERKIRQADAARDPVPSLQAKSRSIQQELSEIDETIAAVGGV